MQGNRSTMNMGHGTRTTWQLISNCKNSTEYQIGDNGQVTGTKYKYRHDNHHHHGTSTTQLGPSNGRMHLEAMETTTRWVLENIQNLEVKLQMDNRVDKKLLGVMWDMWQHWNNMLHKNLENQIRILETETNMKVTKLYTLGPSAFTIGNTLLKHPLSELLQLPHAYKKHWVETATRAKEWQDRWKAGPYQSECRAMQIWLMMFNRIGT